MPDDKKQKLIALYPGCVFQKTELRQYCKLLFKSCMQPRKNVKSLLASFFYYSLVFPINSWILNMVSEFHTVVVESLADKQNKTEKDKANKL